MPQYTSRLMTDDSAQLARFSDILLKRYSSSLKALSKGRWPLLAERLRQQLPALLAEIPQGSRMAAITEGDILPAARELAGRGLFVEPSSALTWAALKQLIEVIPEPVVLILSGNGLKQPF